MNYSENYGFALPDDGDFYDIAPISENFDAIDTILAEGESKMEEISNKIGTPAENGQTLFSLMSSGSSVIRSIQRKILSYTDATKTTEIPITPVDPAKTIVIMERLKDYAGGGLCEINYTLSANKLQMTIGPYYGIVGFWIVEFA